MHNLTRSTATNDYVKAFIENRIKMLSLKVGAGRRVYFRLFGSQKDLQSRCTTYCSEVLEKYQLNRDAHTDCVYKLIKVLEKFDPNTHALLINDLASVHPHAYFDSPKCQQLMVEYLSDIFLSLHIDDYDLNGIKLNGFMKARDTFVMNAYQNEFLPLYTTNVERAVPAVPPQSMLAAPSMSQHLTPPPIAKPFTAASTDQPANLEGCMSALSMTQENEQQERPNSFPSHMPIVLP